MTCEVSAPESRNTTTRLPPSMSWPRVGQADCLTGTDGGTYASGVMPAASKIGFHTVLTLWPSGFVNNSVKTSFGFASRNVLTFCK